MTKRKTTKPKTIRKTTKSKKNGLSKKLITLLTFLAITPLLAFGYLYYAGYLELNFDTKEQGKRGAKEAQELRKKNPIEDKDLIDKISKVLSQTKEKKPKKIEKAPNLTLPKLELKKQIKQEEKVVAQSFKEINKTKEKSVFPIISDVLDEQKPTEAEDYLHSTKETSEKPKKVAKKAHYKGRPKVAIIIDDVSFEAQTKKIKQIPYKVTPSFFPPTKRHPDTRELAKTFPFYMIHLPMEAFNHAHPESRTLKKGESFESIHAWIQQIKRDFPKARYYNNHTGSKFTSDFTSMNRLFKAFEREHLIFLDSLTTARSQVKKVAKKYKKRYIKRDVFLDNSFDEKYIKKQLREVVRIAKLQGYAIAICHPHKSTLKVLREAKPLLKGMKLVYVNEI